MTVRILHYVLLFVVLLIVEKCICRRSFSLPLPSKSPQTVPKIPNSLYLKMKNLTSTKVFLQTITNMYQQQKQKHVLPSQVKAQAMLKSRSSGGPPLRADWVNLEIQTCTVRPYIYFLDQPAPSENAIIWPYAVKLPRCTGSCNVRSDIVLCQGKTKVVIPLTAYRVPYDLKRKRRDVMDEFAQFEDPIGELRKKRSSSQVKILTLNLDAHTSCGCECTATNDSCAKESKVLNKDFCQCECPTKSCKPPYTLDPSQCKCVCSEDYFFCRKSYPLAVLRRMHFDKKKCACECNDCPKKLRKWNKLDKNTCECKCAVKSCPANQRLLYRRLLCACV